MGCLIVFQCKFITSIITDPLRLCLFSQQVCALRVCTLLVALMSLAALQWVGAVVAFKLFFPKVRNSFFVNDWKFHKSHVQTLKGQSALFIIFGCKVMMWSSGRLKVLIQFLHSIKSEKVQDCFFFHYWNNTFVDNFCKNKKFVSAAALTASGLTEGRRSWESSKVLPWFFHWPKWRSAVE